jgi:hypothetical protein
MAKIYVSSTYLDLQEFRDKVLHHLHRLQQTVTAMEYYLADDRRPADKCIADVKQCDIYVGIFAWRYGTIPQENNPEQLSITEMEYLAAYAKGIPCLIFLHDGKSPWPPNLVDDDKTRIKAFRQRLEREHTPLWFKNADELASLVGASLYDKLTALGMPTTSITSFDLEKYFAALRTRYSVLPLEGLTQPERDEYLRIQLRQVFVEQNARENPPPVELPKEVWEKLAREKEIHPDDLPRGITLDDVRRAREAYYQQPARPVLDVLTDARYPHLIILGDPGSGKSTLARYVALSLIDPATSDARLQKAFAGYLPLLIELRTFVGLCAENKCESFLEFLEHLGKTEGWGLTQKDLHRYLKDDGRALVIFDGLDEIFNPEQRERVTRQIVGWTIDYPKTRVLVTSRIIGYQRKILTDAGFAHFTLQDLDKTQVETFVSRWYELAMPDRPDDARKRRARVLRAFDESAPIRQLAGNPMLLTIMAIIGKHQELPHERWKLYDHAASVLIYHWDINKHLRDARIDADFIGEEDKKELLRRLAYTMQGGDVQPQTLNLKPETLNLQPETFSFAGNYIHREQLQAVFESYLRERYAQTADRAKVIAEAMIQQFRERNFILVLYGANLYGFVHRAFLEYFCAAAFVRQFEKTQELALKQLKTEVYGKHWHDQNWHEVLRLICGMLDERWAGEIITFLTHANPDWQKKEGQLPWHIALALHCLGEVRNPSAIPNAAGDVLESLFSLFEFGMSGFRSDEHQKFMREQIDAGITALGALPTEGKLEALLEQFRPEDQASWYADSFGKLVAKTAGGRASVRQILLRYLKSRDANYRVLVPYALALGWHDAPDTLPLLRDRAINDAHEDVRRAAVEALAAHYRNAPDTLPLLRDRAINDAHEDVRRAAVRALAAHYRDAPDTLPLLRDRAIHDASEWTRRVAVEALAQFYRDAPDTLPLLRDRAINDAHEDVRSAAVAALAEHYRDAPDTLPLVRDRAINDYDWWVRSAAVEALAAHYRDAPDTLPLLRDRAIHDANEIVRRAAVLALAKFYRDAPDTVQVLRELAMRAPHDDVRSAAVAALAEHYRDAPDTLPLLRDRAINDYDWWVRSAAVKTLIQHYHDAPDTLPLLREWAMNSPHDDVRYAAVAALAKFYRDAPDTAPLLRDRAIHDAHEIVRRAAVEALIQHYRDAPDTLPLLRDRAVNDESPKPDEQKRFLGFEEYVREVAIVALAKHWRHHPDTLALLRERAQNDPTPWLRERARELAEEIEREI